MTDYLITSENIVFGYSNALADTVEFDSGVIFNVDSSISLVVEIVLR